MKIGIVGSGPTGIAAAATALDRGHTVEILDVGHTLPASGRELAVRLSQAIEAGQPPAPEDLSELGVHQSLELKSLIGMLPFTGLSSKTPVKSVFGSDFVYQGIGEGIPLEGGALPRSLSRGGLSNVWGTACYRLGDSDYAAWPFEKSAFEHHYAAAAGILRIPVEDHLKTGIYPPGGDPEQRDGPSPWNIGGPLDGLTGKWSANRELLDRAGLRVGRSSLATMPSDEPHARHCRQCGLCFFGCPFDAMYRSGLEISEWRDHPRFKYRDGVMVNSFREENGQVIADTRGADGKSRDFRFDRFVLAANTLSSLRIVADSVAGHSFRAPLLDNDMFVVPMLADVRMDRGWQSSFALSESVMSIAAGAVCERPVHIQFYSLNDYFLGAASRLLPAIIRRSKFFGRLVIAFIYLHSDESRNAHATPTKREGGLAEIKIDYSERNGRAISGRVLGHLRKHRHLTGLSPIGMMLKSAPFGFSGHLAGALPMRDEQDVNTEFQGSPYTKPSGKLCDTDNVFVADASNFPNLPAQNSTFTAMANAVRIVSDI